MLLDSGAGSPPPDTAVTKGRCNKEFPMAEIAVSFFSEPYAKSRTRRVSFPHVVTSQLHEAIRETMRGSEFFACYFAPEGGVIALDRHGITISV